MPCLHWHEAMVELWCALWFGQGFKLSGKVPFVTIYNVLKISQGWKKFQYFTTSHILLLNPGFLDFSHFLHSTSERGQHNMSTFTLEVIKRCPLFGSDVIRVNWHKCQLRTFSNQRSRSSSILSWKVDDSVSKVLTYVNATIAYYCVHKKFFWSRYTIEYHIKHQCLLLWYFL